MPNSDHSAGEEEDDDDAEVAPAENFLTNEAEVD